MKGRNVMFWGYHSFHPIFGILFFILLLSFFFLRFFMWRRYSYQGCFGGREDAFSILQKRLVNGEINEEEYLRLKEVLKK
ncbi:hypothetical protein COD92_10840 [Bacillus sp. AFS037270]|nr:hypothetical protein COD92_10840 [Bacillus sp. AFS037270]